VVRVVIYNQAGEAVSHLLNAPADGVFTTVEIRQGDAETVYANSDEPLKIIIKGVGVAYSAGNTETVVEWDCKNNAGQKLSQGIYYIKVEQTDTYGHINGYGTTIQLFNMENYIEARIFNSSGELVRVVRQENTLASGGLSLKIADTFAFQQQGPKMGIIYGNNITDIIEWDGKNSRGETVSSGTYEVQVVAKNIEGKTVVASKTVVVLKQDPGEIIGKVKITPNPSRSGADAVFSWEDTSSGEMFIRIYNMAGGLVKTLAIQKSAGFAQWDKKNHIGEKIGPGIYTCLIEARSNGFTQRKILKIGILK
jgi:flagellar hook assembly protein FlgD